MNDLKRETKPKIPSYFLFRIIFVAGFIYTMLVFPFGAMVRITQFSDLFSAEKTDQLTDSLINNVKDNNHSLKIHIGGHEHENFPKVDYERPKLISHTLNSLFLSLGILAFIILSIPYKIYFRRLRKKKPISDKLRNYVRKYFVKLPHYNFLIVFLLPLLSLIFGLFEISHRVDFVVNKHLMAEKQLMIIHIIATVLTAVFVYFWQKNRQQFFYIEHIFSPEELREPLKSPVKTKIAQYFLISHLITIAFPVIVIVFYLIMSVSTFTDAGITELNDSHKQVLFNDFLSLRKHYENPDNYSHGIYINSDSTVVLVWGLAESFISVFIYLLFFIKWSTRLVLKPVNHLLQNMQITSDGNMQNFAIVRSNDEIGLLATEYNKMSARLKNYFDELSDLNKNLEQKVIDRTRMISEQKEEIESQRDTVIEKNTEIETQRDALLEKNNEIEAQNEEIKLQRDILAGQQKEIKDSINYAKRIQQAVFTNQMIFGQDQMFVVFMPRDVVSGDFYFQAEIGGKKIIAAADCTGHGVPGAFMSMLGISFLNEIFKHPYRDAADVLDKLRQNVKDALGQNKVGTSQKDGMDIALCIIDEKTKYLEYSGAFNPLYINRKDEFIEIKATRNPIGIYLKETPFENHTVELQSGDQIYIFSDGFADQLGGPNGRKLKVKPFKALLRENYMLPIETQKQNLETAFESWKGDQEQLDDVLLIGIRF